MSLHNTALELEQAFQYEFWDIDPTFPRVSEPPKVKNGPLFSERVGLKGLDVAVDRYWAPPERPTRVESQFASAMARHEVQQRDLEQRQRFIDAGYALEVHAIERYVPSSPQYQQAIQTLIDYATRVGMQGVGLRHGPGNYQSFFTMPQDFWQGSDGQG